ncbi:MAG: DUF4395 family protein [Actinobacteria bacterium]|nr:DUF4395 family protein [Actinomycetota bacterium]
MQVAAEKTVAAPRVDPYGVGDVIDARAPRFNQATVGTIALIALLTGWWGLLGLLALQLVIGLIFGRRFCLPCVFYFEVVQPRIGEGRLEDSRPPRFANILGASCLTAATLAHIAGLGALGWALGGIVAALALLAAATGLCVGCQAYRWAARARGVRADKVDKIDLSDLEGATGDDLIVQFSHPLCTGCRELEQTLRARDQSLVVVDVSTRPDLARKYHVAVVPTALSVASDGTVRHRLA